MGGPDDDLFMSLDRPISVLASLIDTLETTEPVFFHVAVPTDELEIDLESMCPSIMLEEVTEPSSLCATPPAPLYGRDLKAAGITRFPVSQLPIPDDLNIWTDEVPIEVYEEYFHSLTKRQRGHITRLTPDHVLQALDRQRDVLDDIPSQSSVMRLLQDKFGAVAVAGVEGEAAIEARISKIAALLEKQACDEAGSTPDAWFISEDAQELPWARLECQFLFSEALGLPKRIEQLAVELEHRPEAADFLAVIDEIGARYQKAMTQQAVEQHLIELLQAGQKAEIGRASEEFRNLLTRIDTEDPATLAQSLSPFLANLLRILDYTPNQRHEETAAPIDWATTVPGWGEMNAKKRKAAKKKYRAKAQRDKVRGSQNVRLLQYFIASGVQDELMGTLHDDVTDLAQWLNAENIDVAELAVRKAKKEEEAALRRAEAYEAPTRIMEALATWLAAAGLPSTFTLPEAPSDPPLTLAELWNGSVWGRDRDRNLQGFLSEGLPPLLLATIHKSRTDCSVLQPVHTTILKVICTIKSHNPTGRCRCTLDVLWGLCCVVEPTLTPPPIPELAQTINGIVLLLLYELQIWAPGYVNIQIGETDGDRTIMVTGCQGVLPRGMTPVDRPVAEDLLELYLEAEQN